MTVVMAGLVRHPRLHDHNRGCPGRAGHDGGTWTHSQRDDDILKAAEDWKAAGRGVALATVVETWGSAPRPVGSNLVIDDEGNFLGLGVGRLRRGRGGDRGDRRDRERQAEDAGIRRRRRDRLEGRAVLRRHHPGVCREGGLGLRLDILKASTPNAPRGARRSSSPIRRAARSAWSRRTRSRRDPLKDVLEAHLRSGKSGIEETTEGKVFLTVHVPPPRLVITGAVHISQALAPIAALLGYDVTIVDPRTAFATPERFPDVKVIAEWPDEALPPLGIDRYTAFVALTHDPKIDDPALLHALERDCFYIGALGSKKTHARRVERLKSQGVSDAQLARIHAPIGLRHRRGVAAGDRGRDHGRDHQRACGLTAEGKR